MTIVCVAGWESFWRGRGFRPTLSDSPRLWSEARARASSGDPRTVVFLGSSVVQAAIDLGAFADATNGPRPLQLGILGSTSLPILEDLADDDAFTGVVVAEHLAVTNRAEGLAHAMLAYRDRAKTSPSEWAEHRLGTSVESRAVFRQSAVSPLVVGRRLALGNPPAPNRVVVQRDRSLRIHPRAVVPAPAIVAHNRRWRSRPEPGPEAEEQARENASRLEAAIVSIRARGGEVVLVYFTCSGPQRRQTEVRHDGSWSDLRETSSAVLVDLREHLDPADVPCSDGAHVDAAAQEALTRTLAGVLRGTVLRRR